MIEVYANTSIITVLAFDFFSQIKQKMLDVHYVKNLKKYGK